MAAIVPAGNEAQLAAALVGSGLVACVLVAAGRSDIHTALIVPAYLIAIAILDFVGQLGADGQPLRAHAAAAATAGAVAAAVGGAGWWRGERWARHLAVSGVVWAAATAALALGGTLPWVTGVALLVGVALAGAAFSRQVYGSADTAALVALLTAFVVGVQDDHGADALAWTAMVAFGAAVSVHGLCRLDVALAAGGAVVTLLSTGVLISVVGADRWGVETARRAGLTAGDMAVTAVVAILAGAGLVLARLRPSSTSWETWGPAAGLAATYLLATIAAGSQPDVRLLVALSGGTLLVATGAWRRTAAPLVIGTFTLIGAVALASWTTLQSLPAWVWMAAGGGSLLVVAALIERRGRDGDATTHAVRRILTTFR
jgi:hypothetical protein